MGNAASAAGEGADAGPHGDEDHCGYRVLGVQAGSPAASAGLVSFFDFIVMANHIPLRRVDNTFIDLIREFEDRPLALQIYNSKSQTLRDVILTPSKRWPGQGMLGVTIRFDFYDHAEEHLVRVLEVVPNSPAELAGLQPMTDYLLGTAETVFKDPDVLEEVLSKNLEQTVDFYVYNTETDTVRTATLMPNLKWGGQGCLGAEIGHGYLHGLPQKCCNTNGTSVFKAPAPHIADATRSGAGPSTANPGAGSRAATPATAAAPKVARGTTPVGHESTVIAGEEEKGRKAPPAVPSAGVVVAAAVPSMVDVDLQGVRAPPQPAAGLG